jgi:hypothetical protein
MTAQIDYTNYVNGLWEHITRQLEWIVKLINREMEARKELGEAREELRRLRQRIRVPDDPEQAKNFLS